MWSKPARQREVQLAGSLSARQSRWESRFGTSGRAHARTLIADFCPICDRVIKPPFNSHAECVCMCVYVRGTHTRARSQRRITRNAARNVGRPHLRSSLDGLRSPDLSSVRFRSFLLLLVGFPRASRPRLSVCPSACETKSAPTTWLHDAAIHHSRERERRSSKRR